MAKWYVAAKKADFNGIGQRFSISPVLARVIRNRDIEGDEAIEKYLHGTIRDLYDPAFLKGSREAVLLLKDIDAAAEVLDNFRGENIPVIFQPIKSKDRCRFVSSEIMMRTASVLLIS